MSAKDKHHPDPTAVSRKRDHIELAFQSQIKAALLDSRFHYEPLLAAHPEPGSWPQFDFLGKTCRCPLWVSSMTGGTEWAATINQNLARAAGEFGFGMGLGSCRSLLYDRTHFADFNVRHLIGSDQPLYANLGIAQVEELLSQNAWDKAEQLVYDLQADGLLIHVNPLQEWLQTEGDHISRPPLESIQQVVESSKLSIIVKEVGQGMGPESLAALLRLPIDAIEFAASGGTNFALLELLRSAEDLQQAYQVLAKVGHSAPQMLGWVNELVHSEGDSIQCRQLIISGGIGTFLDGYALIEQSHLTAVYGQASAMLRHARGAYSDLQQFIQHQIRGLELARAYLRSV